MLKVKVLILIFIFPTVAFAGDIGGRIYFDADQSAESHLRQGYNNGDDVVFGLKVDLYDGSSKQTATSGKGGFYSFDDQPNGVYFVHPRVPGWLDDTSRNLPHRVHEAVAEGHINILAVGDSLGKIGSDKPYPQWLAEHFENLCDVTMHNEHAPGSRSWEWMPGDPKGYYEDRVLPYANEVDLVVMTVGGNDADIYIEDMDWENYDIVQIVTNFFNDPSYVTEIFPRVRQLVEDLHDAAPQADIVYMIYPNYADSAWVAPPLGMFAGAFQSLLGFILELLRHDFEGLEYLTIADQYEYWKGETLDPWLFDAIHFNDLGAEELARVMFHALGGVILDDEHPDDQHSYGLKQGSANPIIPYYRD